MGNPVIGLIIQIKNGYMAGNDTIELPFSRLREMVVKKLIHLGFLKNYEVKGENIKTIKIDLFYKDGRPVLTDLKIFSKPGSRMYVSYKDLKPVLGGLGFSILSTPKGILTNKEARKEKVGGELLFSVW